MDIGAVVERVREVSSVSGDPAAGRSAIDAAITASAEVKSWLAAADARLAAALAAQVSFPEKAIADCTRESLRDAAKSKERSDTLGKVPGFADALDAAEVTAGHVDAITSKAKPLTGGPGRREVIIVADADQPNGSGGPTIDWGIPVELPDRVLAEMYQRATPPTCTP